MYKEYFGFTHEPFGTTPDPRFFYENSVYREASTSLAWGIRARRGLMTLVGAVGTGKTTVLRHLVANAEPCVRCVLADYPPQSFDELLTFTCRQLGLDTSEPQGRLERITALKDVLLAGHAQNTTTALVLDEAQHLTEDTLESIRLLSNLETAGDKALQIVLAGQPELCAKLDQPSLGALKQRITLERRLDRLSCEEIAAYIAYRLSVAGYRGPQLFDPAAVETVTFYSTGVPRLINVLCDNALLATHRASRRRVSSDLVVEVARALRIGPAFDYRVTRPVSADPAAGSQTVPAPDSTEPAGIRARGGLYHARAAAGRQRQAWRPGHRLAKRRWPWAVLGSLAVLLLGTTGVALWRLDGPAVASHDRLGVAPSATTRVGRGPAERVGVQDADARPPERTATSSRIASAEPASPTTAELAGSPAAGGAGEQAGVPETKVAAAGELAFAVPAGPVVGEEASRPAVPSEPEPSAARSELGPAAVVPDLHPKQQASRTATEKRPLGRGDTTAHFGSAAIRGTTGTAGSEGPLTPSAAWPEGLAGPPTGAELVAIAPLPPPPGSLGTKENVAPSTAPAAEGLPTSWPTRDRVVVMATPAAPPVLEASDRRTASGGDAEPVAAANSPGARTDRSDGASAPPPTVAQVQASQARDVGAGVDAPILASPPVPHRIPPPRPTATEAEPVPAQSLPPPDRSDRSGRPLGRGAPPPGSPRGSSVLSADQGAAGAGPLTRTARQVIVPSPSRSSDAIGAAESPARASGGIVREVSRSQRQLIRAISPAVVSVLTSDRGPDRGNLDHSRAPTGEAGLGFIVDPRGYIVTTHRVLGENDAVVVRLADGRRLPVIAIARDLLADLAVLKVDATGLPTVGLGNSSALSVGEVVIAIGEQRGVNRQAAVGAVVATASATGGHVTIDLEITANGSGGPLLNSRGEVIGITVASEVSPGGGLAVPINRAKLLLRGLAAADRPAGLSLQGSPER